MALEPRPMSLLPEATAQDLTTGNDSLLMLDPEADAGSRSKRLPWRVLRSVIEQMIHAAGGSAPATPSTGLPSLTGMENKVLAVKADGSGVYWTDDQQGPDPAILAGYGLEVRGNSTGEFGRFVKNGTRVGILRNMLATLLGQDTPAQPSWFAGFKGDAFVIERAVAGSTVFQELFRITVGGYHQIPTSQGAPSYTPATVPGLVPFVYDELNDKIWVYSGSAWKSPQGGGASTTTPGGGTPTPETPTDNNTSINDYQTSTSDSRIGWMVIGNDVIQIGSGVIAAAPTTVPSTGGGMTVAGRQVTIAAGSTVENVNFSGYHLVIPTGAKVTLRNSFLDATFATVHGIDAQAVGVAEGGHLALEWCEYDGKKQTTLPGTTAQGNVIFFAHNARVDLYRSEIYDHFSDAGKSEGGLHYESYIHDGGYSNGNPHIDGWEFTGSRASKIDVYRCNYSAKRNPAAGSRLNGENGGIKCYEETGGSWVHPVLVEESVVAGGYYPFRPQGSGGTLAADRRHCYLNCRSRDYIDGGGAMTPFPPNPFIVVQGLQNLTNAGAVQTIANTNMAGGKPGAATLQLNSGTAGTILATPGGGTVGDLWDIVLRERGTSRWDRRIYVTGAETFSGLTSTKWYEGKARLVRAGARGDYTALAILKPDGLTAGGGGGPPEEPPPSETMTFDAATDVPDGGYALSSGNTVATATGSADTSIIRFGPTLTGKKWWRTKVAANPGGDWVAGIAKGNPTPFMGGDSNAYGRRADDGAGWYQWDKDYGNLAGASVGEWIEWAFDAGSNLLWSRLEGGEMWNQHWSGSDPVGGDPTTGTDGQAVDPGTWLAAFHGYSGDACEISCVGTPPSGFSKLVP